MKTKNNINKSVTRSNVRQNDMINIIAVPMAGIPSPVKLVMRDSHSNPAIKLNMLLYLSNIKLQPMIESCI